MDPGESVTAVVDLGTSFDFSKPGIYQVEFLSPRISHVAETPEDMAETMDDLGPVQIPANKVSFEIGSR